MSGIERDMLAGVICTQLRRGWKPGVNITSKEANEFVQPFTQMFID